MRETDFPIDVLLSLRGVLEISLREKGDVYVAGSMFLYDEEGNPASVERGHYRKLPLSLEGALYSEQLGLKLRPQGSALQLVDPRTGDSLPSFQEVHDRMVEAGRRAEREARRAEHAERERKRLRERLATEGIRGG